MSGIISNLLYYLQNGIETDWRLVGQGLELDVWSRFTDMNLSLLSLYTHDNTRHSYYIK